MLLFRLLFWWWVCDTRVLWYCVDAGCINSVVVFSFMFFRLLVYFVLLRLWLLICLCLWGLLIAGLCGCGL